MIIGSFLFANTYKATMTVKIRGKVYIDPTAVLIGNISIEDGASIWPFAVLRGDLNTIAIGEGTNIQEHTTIHGDESFPNIIGRNVSIGHGAVIHGATIGDYCIIGMQSTILNGTVIGNECIIGAGALVTAGMKIPPKSVVVGVPAKIIREGDESIKEKAARNAEEYHKLRDSYLAGKYDRYKSH